MKLKVRSKPDKFRRAGFSFTKDAQEIEVDQKTCAALKAEPMLIVEQVEEEKKQVEVEREQVEKKAEEEKKEGGKGTATAKKKERDK